MSSWLPARPEGTKDHRELTQRGTDMSFSPSPSIPTLQSPGPETRTPSRGASGPRRPRPNPHLIKQACADAAVGGTNTVRQLYCRKRGADARMRSSLQADGERINQAHLRDVG